MLKKDFLNTADALLIHVTTHAKRVCHFTALSFDSRVSNGQTRFFVFG
tara:strand:+ start:1226 stop:1369 length:144 start_codon:yes stop_codon:yes gene_type:complete